tara:strand:- start:605 stop:1102 length:498 start_codon:yes stop_codon:yes gene_type:complete
MPGLGKYKKGAKFTLKSGNNPAFKMMAGESPITSPANMNNFGIGKGTSPLEQLADPDEQAKNVKEWKEWALSSQSPKEDPEAKAKEAAKAAKKAKLGAAGRNLAEIFMGGIHNVYGNPSKTTKTSEFDEEKAYKRWAKEKSDKETMTLAQQIIADDKKKSQIKKA